MLWMKTNRGDLRPSLVHPTYVVRPQGSNLAYTAITWSSGANILQPLDTIQSNTGEQEQPYTTALPFVSVMCAPVHAWWLRKPPTPVQARRHLCVGRGMHPHMHEWLVRADHGRHMLYCGYVQLPPSSPSPISCVQRRAWYPVFVLLHGLLSLFSFIQI
jgi:hypothetical protein